ncbi:conserved Plasmodium protein, unknown function [Plasmodium malariae]|uniref:Uncharacterized protein n=1 Tax=Plasmodium malariae TaxID=5858 RepID=A0A1C3KBP5_PLAMA|nr:conserved Plasmodium protein, unknown function [Plasmodium malariae]
MNRDKLKYNKMNYNKFECANTNYGKINYNKMNLFCENFDMNYVLDELKKNFDKRKHLMCDINDYILSSEKKKKDLNEYEENLIEKQTKILTHTKTNYKKLNNINYVKYYLPYCIQPKTNNTNMCLRKNSYLKNSKKQNILRELNIKKKLTEYKIDRFIKKYTGKFKTKSILHKQISEIYKEKCKIEICIKNKKNSMLNFNVAIGHIAFFDYKENILLENVTFVNNSNEKKLPWIFIQSSSIMFFKKIA